MYNVLQCSIFGIPFAAVVFGIICLGLTYVASMLGGVLQVCTRDVKLMTSLMRHQAYGCTKVT